MKHNSERGTTYRSIRHRDNQTVAEHSTPERAVEQSLGAKTSIPREHPALDERAATQFKPSKTAEAEDRIGASEAPHGSRSQPMQGKAAESKAAERKLKAPGETKRGR